MPWLLQEESGWEHCSLPQFSNTCADFPISCWCGCSKLHLLLYGNLPLSWVILVPIYWAFSSICYLKKRSDGKSWTQHWWRTHYWFMLWHNSVVGRLLQIITWMLSSSKWKEEGIWKLYLCISSTALHLFAEDSIQALSYSKTVQPHNQFRVLHASRLNALGLLLICRGFNLPLGLALHGSFGIPSSSALVLTNCK